MDIGDYTAIVGLTLTVLIAIPLAAFGCRLALDTRKKQDDAGQDLEEVRIASNETRSRVKGLDDTAERLRETQQGIRSHQREMDDKVARNEKALAETEGRLDATEKTMEAFPALEDRLNSVLGAVEETRDVVAEINRRQARIPKRTVQSESDD